MSDNCQARWCVCDDIREIEAEVAPELHEVEWCIRVQTIEVSQTRELVTEEGELSV